MIILSALLKFPGSAEPRQGIDKVNEGLEQLWECELVLEITESK